MELLENKTKTELLRSVLAEIAKSNNELKCAQQDLKKAKGRLNFLIVVTNELLQRID